MLDDTLRVQLSGYLEKVIRPIEIFASVNASAKSQDMMELLTEIATLCDRISLTKRPADDERVPSLSINSPGQSIHLRFAGIPMGHEFTSLVLALLHVGGHPPRVEQAVLDQIKAIDSDLTFETYFSLSCQNCPEVVQALNLMAVLNPRIKHVAIDGGMFPHEVESRQIMSVPTVYLNGQLFAQGRMELEEVIAKLDGNAAGRADKSLMERAPYDVLVIGGGPAGATAAIYTARKGISTALATERFGGQVLDTMAIENFITVRHTEGPQFASALEAHVKNYSVDVVNFQRAEKLVPGGEFVSVEFANGATVKSRAVILSTGARWRQLGVPGEEKYHNKGVAYCPHCDGPLFKGKRVAVIGGGNSGVEAAIDLANIADHVTLVEFDSKLRADDVLQRKLHSLNNVGILLSAKTTEVVGDGRTVTGLVYESCISGERHSISLEGVFVQIGLLPNTEWLKGTVDLTPQGEIIIDPNGKTSVQGVFAAGDCTTVPYKQIVIAAGEGAKASLAAFDYLMRLSAPDGKATKAA